MTHTWIKINKKQVLSNEINKDCFSDHRSDLDPCSGRSIDLVLHVLFAESGCVNGCYFSVEE